MNTHVSIKTKIVVSVLAVLLVGLTATGAFLYSGTKSRIYNDLNKLGQDVPTRLAINLADTIWNVKKEQAIKVIQSEMVNRNIEAVAVYLEDGGGVFAGMQRDDAWNPVAVDKEIEKSAFSETTLAIEKEGEKLGHVKVVLTDRFIGEQIRRLLLNFIALFGCLFVVIALLLIYLISHFIMKPISRVVAFAGKMAKADLSAEVEIISKDEIGEMGNNLNEAVGNVRNIIKELANTISSLFLSSEEMSAVSSQMGSCAKETSEKSSTVTSAAESMTGNMHSVASAMGDASARTSKIAEEMENLTSSIDEIAQNSAKARASSSEAVLQAEKTTEKMEELGSAALDINNVTETITEISNQINLLALNATIEAARAGESGKGFAVVANEIKDLAKQTADATQEIKKKIDGIQESTDGSVSEIRTIAKQINNFNEIVSIIGTAVEEQNASTNEIANNVAEASQLISDVHVNMTQSTSDVGKITEDIVNVNQSADEISTISSKVNTNALDLSKLAEQLKSMESQFKI